MPKIYNFLMKDDNLGKCLIYYTDENGEGYLAETVELKFNKMENFDKPIPLTFDLNLDKSDKILFPTNIVDYSLRKNLYELLGNIRFQISYSKLSEIEVKFYQNILKKLEVLLKVNSKDLTDYNIKYMEKLLEFKNA